MVCTVAQQPASPAAMSGSTVPLRNFDAPMYPGIHAAAIVVVQRSERQADCSFCTSAMLSAHVVLCCVAASGGLLGSASLPAAAGPALVPEPATAGLAPAATVPALAAGDSAADPLSLSPTMRELARVSPIRVTSSQPLAGADIDNTALVGATSTGTSLDEAHTAAARRASLEAPQAAGGARQQPGATTAAAPAAGKLEPRRSRSMRPLRALGGKDAASLK